MTTIAWDGKSLASDTLSTSGNMKLAGECIKTRRIGNYRVAFAGDYAPAIEFFRDKIIDELHAGTMKFNYIRASEDDFTILIVEDGNTSCWIYNSNSGYWDEFHPPVAIGSGSKYALGSMYSGNDAYSAVEISCKLDTHSGFPVHSED